MGLSTVMWRMKMLSPDTAVRLNAVKHLGLNRAFPLLRRALRDSSHAVRMAATDALRPAVGRRVERVVTAVAARCRPPLPPSARRCRPLAAAERRHRRRRRRPRRHPCR